MQILELNPPHKPRSAVKTTHKYFLSSPVPTKSFGAFCGSLIDFVKFNIIFYIMSGEGLNVSFRRTSMTEKSNAELLREFQKIIYSSRVMKHMKWYGQAESVQLIEHGDEELPKFQQEYVAIKDTFEFYISTYESWYNDANNYECHETEGSYVC